MSKISVPVWMIIFSYAVTVILWSMTDSPKTDVNTVQQSRWEIPSPDLEIDSVNEVHLINQSSFEPWKL